jgi:3-keto steroid reductase
VRIEPLHLDLCSLLSVYRAARELRERYERIDVVVCNAGIGGWDGFHWPGLFKQLFTEGPLRALGAPNYKICRVGALAEKQFVTVNTAKGEGGVQVLDEDGNEMDGEPKLAEVFCANVFGHYVFVREMMPLLNRRAHEERARVVWVSTVEAYAKYFDPQDLQGFTSNNAYESSKRLTDLLVLGNKENAAAKAYITGGTMTNSDDKTTSKRRTRSSKRQSTAQTESQGDQEDAVPPKMFSSHPGIVVTDILPLTTFLVYMQIMCFHICKLLGSQWHNVTTEKGVTASVWLTLENDTILEKEKVDKRKWGSATNRWGKEKVVETHVEDLGTERFDELSANCWEQMESLRGEWDGRIREWEEEH